ncbi:hypothetical protein [Methanosalsum natronophilum]|uniref:Uncharacterized protein n=1 Tax=Methanosalsum natronophilum TaxID=768733 RepID=A0A3R7XJ77_9EURY|nr:hypothetical protein [Methanosalsum natronophilum]MCS3924408.1 hypothetical protein [Methanosalsum natronophilum]RQD91340.1 MAG: hypothetical protein D5R95_01165 [Methanosalsum natronophilum]
MSIHSINLIHKCTLICKTTIGQDEYGSPVYTETMVETECRFINVGIRDPGDIMDMSSGKRVYSGTTVMLPPTISVTEGMIVRGQDTGYERDYRVISIKPVYYMFRSQLHHYECELGVVE